MPRGDSGRIVLEIDPGTKRRLYAALDEDAITLKHWFLRQVDQYIRRSQPSLFEDAGSTNGAPMQ